MDPEFCCTSDVNYLQAAVADNIFRRSSAEATEFPHSGPIHEDHLGPREAIFRNRTPLKESGPLCTSWTGYNCKGYQMQHCTCDTKTLDAWVTEQTEDVFVVTIITMMVITFTSLLCSPKKRKNKGVRRHVVLPSIALF